MNDESILVLEDDQVTMKVVKNKLANEGYRVVGVATTNEAIQIIREYQIDLMILDLTLLAEDPFNGVTDGFAFRQWLLKACPGANFPIIVHTADNSSTLEARALAHGISRVVRKGDEMSVLLGAVRQTLDQRKCDQSA